jgi:branched-chain amino acid transport system substrate-binding protein
MLLSKPRYKGILTVVASAALLAGCGTSSGSQVQSKSGLPSSVTIPVLQSLSGEFATFGKADAEGAQFAAYVANRNHLLGSTTIKVALYDDASTSQQAVVNMGKIAASTAPAVYGPLIDPFCSATSPITKKYNILQVVSSCDATPISPAETNFFNITPPDPSTLAILGEYLKAKKITNLTFVEDPTFPNEVDLVVAAKTIMRRYGITLNPVVKIDQTQTQFLATASQVAQSKPGAVDVLPEPAVPIFTRELRNAGYDGALAAFKLSPNGAQAAGSAADGLVTAVTFSALERTARVKNFVSEYKAWSHGTLPGSYTAEGYDAMTFILLAIKKAASTSRAQVIAGAADVARAGFVGVEGHYNFDNSEFSNHRANVAPVLVEYGPQGLAYKVLSYP